jgi:hypothetical protein
LPAATGKRMVAKQEPQEERKTTANHIIFIWKDDLMKR